MLELHYFPLSTTSQKVRLCLFHKDIEVRERIVDLGRLEQLAPEYLAMNPRAEVPTLVADGVVITESSIINEYLEERFPESPLLPGDAAQRARVRMWTRELDRGATVAIAQPTYQTWVRPAVLAAAPREVVLARVAALPVAYHRERWQRTVGDGIDESTIAAAWGVVESTFAKMESMLAAGGPYLFGRDYTLADVETTPIVLRAVHLGRTDLIVDKPHLAAWFERMQSMENFASTYSFLQSAMKAPVLSAA